MYEIHELLFCCLENKNIATTWMCTIFTRFRNCRSFFRIKNKWEKSTGNWKPCKNRAHLNVLIYLPFCNFQKILIFGGRKLDLDVNTFTIIYDIDKNQIATTHPLSETYVSHRMGISKQVNTFIS